MSLDPAVAAVRLAVRRCLADVGDRPLLVACSGGADSLALLAATVAEARRRPRRVVGVTVDHGLQQGSEARAAAVVAQMAGLGTDETVSVTVEVTASGQGPEAAAREARYAVLAEVAQRWGAEVVLLGHTLDDQAETVLLGLARGSGARALAGMRRDFEVYRRPLLQVTRARTRAACRAEGIGFWDDPHNRDLRYTRARVRQRVLPVLEEELGPGVAAALARTADLLREDTGALDEIARTVHTQAVRDDGLDAEVLAVQHLAVLHRVLREAALAAGAPAAELFRVHVLALATLVCQPASVVGSRQIQLPGRLTAHRDGNRLRFRRTAVSG